MAGNRFILSLGFVTVLLLAGCQSMPQTPQVSLAGGYQAYANHDYAAAHHTAVAFLQAYPQSVNVDEAFYLAALAQEAQGHIAEAKTDYLAAIAHSQRPQLICKSSAALGDISYVQGHFQRAIKYYQRAMRTDPAVGLPASGLMRLGISQQNVGDWTSADTTFSALEQLAPGTTAATIAAQRYGQTHFAVQYGAYTLSSAAWNELRALHLAGVSAQVVPSVVNGRTLYLVQSGFYSTFSLAMTARNTAAIHAPQAIVVP